LCTHYRCDIDRIIKADTEELLTVKGFGQAIAHRLRTYKAHPGNLALLRRVLGYLRIKAPSAAAAEETALPLSGLTFVITGDVNRFPNRKAMQGFIEDMGGRTASAVSAKTSYLINNDAASPSGKNKKARELNVPVLTEEEFMSKFLFG
jgi:DNA ligase (NAD+)